MISRTRAEMESLIDYLQHPRDRKKCWSPYLIAVDALIAEWRRLKREGTA